MSERRGPLKGVNVVELAHIMAGPVRDITAGIPGALGVSAAYVHKVKTGGWQRVDASLFEAAIAHTRWQSAITFATGRVPGPMGSAEPLTPDSWGWWWPPTAARRSATTMPPARTICATARS